MITIPAIDMVATGRNITKLRKDAGLTVRDLHETFCFATPQAIYKWQHGVAMPILDNSLEYAVSLLCCIFTGETIQVLQTLNAFDSKNNGSNARS